METQRGLILDSPLERLRRAPPSPGPGRRVSKEGRTRPLREQAEGAGGGVVLLTGCPSPSALNSDHFGKRPTRYEGCVLAGMGFFSKNFLLW